jgi:predicted ATPase/class 3 adenylate cyclase
MKMKCPKCQSENPEGVKFCGECGNKLEIRCSKCNAANPPQFKFCGECGQAFTQAETLSPVNYNYNHPQSYTPKHLADKILTSRSTIEGERKLVTVLFADVAGFTAISEKLDAEQVHEVMDGCFRILMDEIHRFEGTINQFTGDGVMAIFGAPIAHEDHAQRACHAALAIQRAIEPYAEKLKTVLGIEFRLRIGINSGPVVVGSIGDDLRMDYTAQGDTSNLASRMESHAELGTALISENTYRLVKDFFELASKGKLQVKGKQAPVEAYRLEGAGEVVTRIGASAAKGLTRFVGRTPEIEALKEVFAKAQSGQGQVVGIVGEAGVGKSRLLLELCNTLPERDYTYLEGHCLHYGGAMPYLPILDVFRSYIGIKEGERESVVREKINERILGLDENLSTAIPPFQELLSLKPDDEKYAELEPKQKREKTFEAFRDLIVRGSQERPLILAIEDLHWIDKTSEEFLDYMIGWLPTTHILLVLLYRPEYTHAWGSKSYYGKIGVDQLSSDTSAELVRAILDGGNVMPNLRDLILSRASGNPFFMEELTHSLLEDGSIRKKDGHYVLGAKVSDIQVPDTVQGIIAARMDRLEEGLKRIMQVASVIGREFAFRILNAITEMKEDLKSNLVNLQGLEFIYEKSLFPELEYIFRHALSQEVAYNSLLLKRRKEIHEKIGNAIEELYPDRLEEFYEMLAYHYAKSNDISRACHYLKLSGDKARKIFSSLQAFEFYNEAAKLLRNQPDDHENRRLRLVVIQPMARLITVLGSPEGSFELLTEGEKLANDLAKKKALAHFQTALGIFYLTSLGNPTKGREYIEKALGEADLIGDTEILIPAMADLIKFSSLEGRYSSICKIAPKTIALIEKAHAELEHFNQGYNQYSVLQALYGVSLAITGKFSEGEPFLKNGLSFALDLNDLLSLGMIEQSYGRFYYEKGDAKNMAKHLRSCISYYEKSKFEMLLGVVWGMLGKAYLFLGQTELALQCAQKGLDMHKTVGVSLWLGYRYTMLGEIHFELGDFENALDYCKQAVPLCQKHNEKPEEAVALISLGRVIGLTSSIEFEKARNLILRGTNILQELEQRPRYATGRFYLGELYAHAGQKEEALQNLEQAGTMFQEMGMDYWLDKTQEVMATL